MNILVLGFFLVAQRSRSLRCSVLRNYALRTTHLTGGGHLDSLDACRVSKGQYRPVRSKHAQIPVDCVQRSCKSEEFDANYADS